jgi:predicted alpha/beta superfamily hydrolase
MKNIIRLVLLVLIVGTLNLKASAQSFELKKDSLYSSILQETRELLIYLPSELVKKEQKQERYPVLFVLDGDTHAQAVSGMIQYLSEQNSNQIFPKMMVVFIKNTNRTRDFTPYKAQTSAMLPEVMAKETGGGDKFLEVFKNEILPYIEQNYPTSAYRAISGHSLGGLFVLSILAQQPDLFEDYLVMDPSLWYDEGKYAQYMIQQLDQHDLSDKSLYIAAANTLGVDQLQDALYTKSPFADHQRNIYIFCESLQQNPNFSLNFFFKYYPKDDHGSVPFIGMYEGLRKIFEPYQLSYYQVSNPLFDPERDILKFFEGLSHKIKTPVKISLEDLNLFDTFYQINQDKEGQKKLRNLYKKMYPKQYEKLTEL